MRDEEEKNRSGKRPNYRGCGKYGCVRGKKEIQEE
jgi:hypothetical protein